MILPNDTSYDLNIKPEADKIFYKLSGKNKRLLRIVNKKLDAIRQNPYHQYKFLRKPLQNLNSVHINGHFVLIFKIDHMKRTVNVIDFGRHDAAYNKRH